MIAGMAAVTASICAAIWGSIVPNGASDPLTVGVVVGVVVGAGVAPVWPGIGVTPEAGVYRYSQVGQPAAIRLVARWGVEVRRELPSPSPRAVTDVAPFPAS